MAYHAKLSASGSKQWINCPASIAAEALNPSPRGSSIFAMEGTAAHLLCEIYTSEGVHPQEFLGETIVIWNDDAVLEKNLGSRREQVRKGEVTSREPLDPDAKIEAEFLVDQDMGNFTKNQTKVVKMNLNGIAMGLIDIDRKYLEVSGTKNRILKF